MRDLCPCLGPHVLGKIPMRRAFDAEGSFSVSEPINSIIYATGALFPVNVCVFSSPLSSGYRGQKGWKVEVIVRGY